MDDVETTLTAAGKARQGLAMAPELKHYRAAILGYIWQPGMGLCSIERSYQAGSDKEAIERARTHEAGDFQDVVDVMVMRRTVCNHGYSGVEIVKDWDNQENGMAYLDTVREEE